MGEVREGEDILRRERAKGSQTHTTSVERHPTPRTPKAFRAAAAGTRKQSSTKQAFILDNTTPPSDAHANSISPAL